MFSSMRSSKTCIIKSRPFCSVNLLTIEISGRPFFDRQTRFVQNSLFVFLLSFDGFPVVFLCDPRIGFRVELLCIDPVDDPRQIICARFDHAFKPFAKIGCLDFLRICRAGPLSVYPQKQVRISKNSHNRNARYSRNNNNGCQYLIDRRQNQSHTYRDKPMFMPWSETLFHASPAAFLHIAF